MPAAPIPSNAINDTEAVRVTALGVVVEVRFPVGSTAVEAFREQWSRALVEGPSEAAPGAVVEPADAPSDEALLHTLTTQVTIAAIEAQAGRLVMLHAAGLADPVSGVAVALVAPSGTGKTTSAAHLGQRWAYLSDETVGVDPSGAVLPYPKPLSIVQPGKWTKAQVSPDSLGLLSPSRSSRLGALVLLVRDGTTPATSERLRRSVAIARLAEHSSFLARLPEPLAALDRAVAGTAGCWEVRYSSLDDLEAAVAVVMAEAVVEAAS